MRRPEILKPDLHPKGQVIAFPADRLSVRIDTTVLALENRSGEQLQKYWRTQVNRLFAAYQCAGFSEPEIEEQILRFTRAVKGQVQARQAMRDAPDDGGVA